MLDNDLNYLREIRYTPPLPRNYKPPIPAFGSHGNFHTLGPWFWDNTWPDGNTMDTQWETLWPNTLCITPGPTQKYSITLAGAFVRFECRHLLDRQFPPTSIERRRGYSADSVKHRAQLVRRWEYDSTRSG